jgi:cation:H+ antiporter
MLGAMLGPSLLFLLSIAVILGGAAVFTNGVEWLGRRLGISDGAIGSILAGVATALPETLIPVIAIFWGATATSVDIGVGAILGAPLMLSTITIPLLAMFLLVLARLKKRTDQFELDYHMVRLDVGFFLAAYSVALVVAMVPVAPVRYGAAIALFIGYCWYVKIHLTTGQVSELEIAPLYFSRKSVSPATFLIIVQSIAGLALLIGGAHMFVHVVEQLALGIGVSPLIFSLLVAPIATELPEKLNSLLWIYQKKDTLAVGNITGAMVFQGTFPVSIGLIGTSWILDTASMISLVLPLLAVGLFFAQAQWAGRWQPSVLILPIFLYAGYMLYLIMR